MQILQGNLLFSEKVYTAGTFFTRPLVITVVTNFKSATNRKELILLHTFKTLTKAPRPKYFDSFNNFISKQKLQQAFKSWSNFSLVLFGKGQEKHRTNFDKTHVTTLTNPYINFGKSM